MKHLFKFSLSPIFLYSVLISVLFFLTVTVLFQGLTILGGWIYIIGIISVILLVFPVKWFLKTILMPKLALMTPRTRRLWVMFSFVGGVILAVAIPIQPFVWQISMGSLEIIATGQKNPASHGMEVWLVDVSDGTQHSLFSQLQQDGLWEQRPEGLVSYTRQPAVLRWQGMVSTPPTVTFLSHSWSGNVQVIWNGQTQNIDLYSATTTSRKLRLDELVSRSSTEFIVSSILNYTVSWGIAGGGLGFILLSLGLILGSHPISFSGISASRWGWMFYAIPSILVWLCYLMAFWPGIMTNDSFDQWSQIMDLNLLHDYHPAIHTLTNWLITRIWFSPTAIALVQIILLAGVFGLTMQEVERWNVSKKVCWVISVIFALMPANGILSITLWKDIFYTIAMLGLLNILLVLARTQGAALQKKHIIMLTGFALLCVALYRHNGLYISIVLLVVLPFLLPRIYLLKIGMVIGVFIIGLFLIKGVLYGIMDVNMVKSTPALMIEHQIAAMLHDGMKPQQKELEELVSLQPIEYWKNKYNCYALTNLVANDKLNVFVANSKTEEMFRIWENHVLEYIPTLVRHQLCVSSMIWEISQPNETGATLVAFVVKIPGNSPMYHTEPQSKLMNEFLTNALRSSVQPQVVWLLWRPAIYLYISLFCFMVISWRLRSRSALLIIMPTLLNTLPLLVLNVSQNFRYQYPVYVITFIACALLFAKSQIDSVQCTLVQRESA